jgi:hypothetical protein
MQISKYIKPLVLGSILSASGASWSDATVKDDPVIPMQKVETTWPAIAWVQVVIQWKIFLLLLSPSDAHLFPQSLAINVGNTHEKVKGILQKMKWTWKLASWTTAEILSYGTTTPVDIGEWKVWFLTASHVLQKQMTPNDICITNRVLGENIPDKGLPILKVSSQELHWKMSYTQFPFYSDGKFMMIQIPSVLRYQGMRQWILWRFERFVWWASWWPVIAENPNKKWEYSIVSIFPWWVSNDVGSMNIAQMPRNEILNEVKWLALEASRKWWDYAVCR